MTAVDSIKRSYRAFSQLDDEKLRKGCPNHSFGAYSTPPSYLVHITMAIAEMPSYGRSDKSDWSTKFSYGGLNFSIEDWKHSQWLIRCEENTVRSQSLKDNIRKSVIKACKFLEIDLKPMLQKEIEDRNFYINNSYAKLRGMYEFHKKKLKRFLKYLERIDSKIHDGDSVEKSFHLIAKRMSREMDIYNFISSLTFSFFSLLEFLLEPIFLFRHPHADFMSFRKIVLFERFKRTFKVTIPGTEKDHYDDLIFIYRKYRNPLGHGLTQQDLIPLKGVGLIPISTDEISNELHFGFLSISLDSAYDILNKMEKFLDFVYKNPELSPYMKYVDSGLPIPAKTSEINKLIGKMSNKKNYAAYLNRMMELRILWMNMDI